MKHKSFLTVLLLLSAFFFSCTSYEDKVLDDLEELTLFVEKNMANFDADDWEEVVEDYADLVDDAVECRFTKAQHERFEKMSSRIQQILYEKGDESFDKNLNDMFK